MSTVKDPFPGESVVKMIFGNNQWVACSDSGKIASSTDGLNWRIASIVVTSSILQIIWVNNQWLVSFTNGNIATSPDGLTWTIATVNPMIGNRLTEILTSSSSYLAYAETSVSIGPPTCPLSYSTNGLTWIAITDFSGNTDGLKRIYNAIYANPYWIVFGQTNTGLNGSTYTIAGVSKDGRTFFKQTIEAFETVNYIGLYNYYSILDLKYNGSGDILITLYNSNTIYSLTAKLPNSLNTSFSWTFKKISDVLVNNSQWGGYNWVFYETNNLIYSPRTINWSTVQLTYFIIRLYWNADKNYWLVPMIDTTNNNAIYSVLLNSDFTIKNTYSAQPKFTLGTSLFWNGSYWLGHTNRLILTSIDGITFTLRYTSTIFFNEVKWTGVCWVIIEIDDEGLNYNLITSRDGIRWNKKNIYSSASIYATVSLAYNNYDIEVCVKVQNTNSFFTYSITTKILYLHSLANIYKGPPIPINYALENPSYLILRVTKEQVPDNFSALRLRLVNISKNNTIQIAKSNTALTTVNNVSSCNVTLFPVSTGNKINFGLIQFEGKKNNKWYTIAYITRKNYIVP